MSLHRRNPKRDKSEGPIVEYLRKSGLSVHLISGTGIPDLLCGFRQQTYLVECKSGKRGLNANQTKFFDEWKGQAPVVLRTVEEAQEWVSQIKEA